MKNVMKLGLQDVGLVLPEDAVNRFGTLGIVGGGLLALAVLMF